MNYLKKYSRLLEKKEEISKNYFMHKGCRVDQLFSKLFSLKSGGEFNVIIPQRAQRDAYLKFKPKDLTVHAIKVLNYMGIPYKIDSRDNIKIAQGYFMIDKMTRDGFCQAKDIEPYTCIDCEEIVDTKPFSYLHYRNNMCTRCGTEIYR